VSIPYRLFREWQVFFSLEPWGEERADLRAGIVASVIANTHRDRKKKPRPYVPGDFMPKFGKQKKRRQSQNELKMKLTLFAKAHNAARKGKRGK
jgi:hypothetical protein